MPIKKKKISKKKPSQTKNKLPFYFKNESGLSLSSLLKKVWQKIDEEAQLAIKKYLNDAFRTSQLQLADLNLVKNPDYRHVFENYQAAEQEDDGYYLLLEDYQAQDYQPLKYLAKKIAYEYLLGIVKSLLWSLSKLPFHRDKYFNQLF